jgi:hypothetical protein
MDSPSARLSRLQPAGAVLVWDATTETFSPRVPAPHSSLPIGATQSHVPALEAGSPTTSCASPHQRRTRHHSNPESILDFDEFLKQMERERTSTESQERQSHLVPIHPKNSTHTTESQVPASSPAKPTKHSLKVVLKEVLGGGGNNNGVNVPKDGVVVSDHPRRAIASHLTSCASSMLSVVEVSHERLSKPKPHPRF